MAKQLESVSGAVRQVNSKGTGVKVNGLDEWLNISQFHPVTTVPTVGELVDVQFERTDKGAWIQSLSIIGASPAGTASAPGPDYRLAAMQTAAQLVCAFSQCHEEVRVEHVFPLADRIFAWLEEKGAEPSA